jgi:hypothetical protein
MALKLNDTFKHIAGKPGAYRNRQPPMMLERWGKMVLAMVESAFGLATRITDLWMQQKSLTLARLGFHRRFRMSVKHAMRWP